MAVGAGSIKRAAKVNTETESKQPVVKNEKKTAVKNTAEKTTSQKTTSQKATPQKAPIQKAVVSKTVQASNSVNEVCHLTEELPVHLL